MSNRRHWVQHHIFGRPCHAYVSKRPGETSLRHDSRWLHLANSDDLVQIDCLTSIGTYTSCYKTCGSVDVTLEPEMDCCTGDKRAKPLASSLCAGGLDYRHTNIRKNRTRGQAQMWSGSVPGHTVGIAECDHSAWPDWRSCGSSIWDQTHNRASHRYYSVGETFAPYSGIIS